MKFGASALLGLVAVTCADAFSINPHANLVQQKLAQVQSSEAAAATNHWRAPMNMVAGGAERSYGEDYYDGMCLACWCEVASCLWPVQTSVTRYARSALFIASSRWQDINSLMSFSLTHSFFLRFVPTSLLICSCSTDRRLCFADESFTFCFQNNELLVHLSGFSILKTTAII